MSTLELENAISLGSELVRTKFLVVIFIISWACKRMSSLSLLPMWLCRTTILLSFKVTLSGYHRGALRRGQASGRTDASNLI